MADIINLQPVPSQTLSITLDGERWVITLKSTGSIMAADVSRDGVSLLSGIRVAAETPLIPYGYLESGNFMLLTEGGDLPDYTKFGMSQILYYATAEELVSIRG